MVLDKLYIGKPEQAKLTQPQSEGKYISLYVFVPYTSKMNVYDGLSATKIATVSQTDTIYWEILSRNELRAANFLPKIYQSLIKVSENVGNYLADNFFGTWVNVQRYLYSFSNSSWLNAYQYATDFKWTAAIEIWMADVDSPDKLKSACAAFNLAVACEMTGRIELALDWIEYSRHCYPLQGVDSYKSILKGQLEKQGDSQTKP
jgi:hypothetical protein